MSENGIDSANSKPTPDTAKPKGARKAGKKARSAKRADRAKKPSAEPKAERTNKKSEVIAMMKRAKGATLPEIMKATGWQSHTVRGFVSILGSREERRSSRPRTLRANGRTRSVNSFRHLVVPMPLWSRARAAFLLLGGSHSPNK